MIGINQNQSKEISCGQRNESGLLWLRFYLELTATTNFALKPCTVQSVPNSLGESDTLQDFDGNLNSQPLHSPVSQLNGSE